MIKNKKSKKIAYLNISFDTTFVNFKIALLTGQFYRTHESLKLRHFWAVEWSLWTISTMISCKKRSYTVKDLKRLNSYYLKLKMDTSQIQILDQK